jgi:hypothetical protein
VAGQVDLTALTEKQKFELLEALVKDLGVQLDPGSVEERRVRDRKDALQALLTVSEYLGLPAGEAPTIKQFDLATEELGLGWSSGKVIRAWERWRTAVETFKGERRAGSTLYREFQRDRDRSLKNREEPIRGVRRWLRSHPAEMTSIAYDEYARAINAEISSTKSDDDPVKRLRSSWSVRNALILRWSSALAVARREIGMRAAREQELAELLPKATTNAILGLPGAARLLGRSETSVKQARNTSRHFPVAVAVIGGQRGWAHEDLKRYKRGLVSAKRKEGEKQYLYVDRDELQDRLKLNPAAFNRRLLGKRWDLIPRPEGWVGVGAPYWLRTKVEDWLRVKDRAEMTPEEEDARSQAQARKAAALGASLGAGSMSGKRRPGRRRKRSS